MGSLIYDFLFDEGLEKNSSFKLCMLFEKLIAEKRYESYFHRDVFAKLHK